VVLVRVASVPELDSVVGRHRRETGTGIDGEGVCDCTHREAGPSVSIAACGYECALMVGRCCETDLMRRAINRCFESSLYWESGPFVPYFACKYLSWPFVPKQHAVWLDPLCPTKLWVRALCALPILQVSCILPPRTILAALHESSSC